jgi:hypothetical protein
VSRALSRVALLFGWALVLWGTLLLGATAVRAVEGGLGTALLELVPRGESAAWAWANVLAVACALVAWPVAVSVLLRLRKAR